MSLKVAKRVSLIRPQHKKKKVVCYCVKKEKNRFLKQRRIYFSNPSVIQVFFFFDWLISLSIMYSEGKPRSPRRRY